MKRASKTIINEILTRLQRGMSTDEIVADLNNHGLTTPNGCAWNYSNVTYYRKEYGLNKKVLATKPRRSRTVLTKEPTTTVGDKVAAIIGLGLSKETTIKALAEIM